VSYTDEELFASAREDAFTGLVKCVSVTEDRSKALRDEVKPHFEAIMAAIDKWVH
jgi:hypothetical protein